MAGIATVVGDFDGALRRELACLEELRGQDEPYWMTVATLPYLAACWRRPRGATTPPSATCARRGPWRGGSITPG